MIGGPLAFLVGFLTPSVSLSDVRGFVKPNPYAKAMPSQVQAAAATFPRGTLRGGLSGLTGSEADYPDEQKAGNASIGAPLDKLNDGLARRAPMPASWYHPHFPAGLVEGRGTGPQTGAYNKGWVRLRIGGGAGWGATTRDTAPSVKAGTLLWPTDRAPLPGDVAQAYQDAHKGRTRLSDMFGD